MEETKKINKGIMTIIVLLILIILSLISYIIYEKIESDKTKQNQNTTSSTTKVINDNNLYKTTIEELLKSKGKTLSENFENVELYFKNISFNLSCTEFNSENKYCDKYNKTNICTDDSRTSWYRSFSNNIPIYKKRKG